MRLALVVLLLLAACSSSDPGPNKGDGGPNDVAWDASPEASSDAPGPDAPPPDVPAVGDAAADAGPDAAPIDAPADVAAVGDVGPDAAPPDVARDAVLEAAADVVAPDATAPDPLASMPDGLSITLATYAPPSSQRCTASLAGALVDFSADFMSSGGGRFPLTGRLPLEGPATLSDGFNSSVDVMRVWGPVYSVGGIRRVNVRASATLGGRSTVVTILGCPVT